MAPEYSFELFVPITSWPSRCSPPSPTWCC